jgi:hypothetical protein
MVLVGGVDLAALGRPLTGGVRHKSEGFRP